MYRILMSIALSLAACAAGAQTVSAPPLATAAQQAAPIIQATLGVGLSTSATARREASPRTEQDRAAAATEAAGDESSQPPGAAMLLAALALMTGIALRRLGGRSQ